MAVDVQSPDVELADRLAERTAELKEALERQAAIAELLQLINDSSGDRGPVFDAILDKALKLCGAALGALSIYDGDSFNRIAVRGDARWVEYARNQRLDSRPGNVAARILAGERVVHIVDLASEASYLEGEPNRRMLVDVGGVRTLASVALTKGDALLGIITLFRQEVRPFSERQIALLQSFAAQAVMVLENARLVTELQQRTGDLQESLDRQTATTEILQVINSSPGDLAPVFDAMLEKAIRVCAAAFGTLLIYDGERFTRAAVRGDERYLEFAKDYPPIYVPGTGPARVLQGERVVHILDLATEAPYREGHPNSRALVDLAGARTILAVPLLKGETVLGIITIFRQEVRPYSDKQIALLQSFAAQAAIAMENARLITELRQRTADLQQSLEYQTATSDVLKVIRRSASDLEPVLRTVVETAARRCQAEKAIIYRHENGAYRYAVGYGNEPDYERIERDTPIYPGQETLVGRTALGKRTVQIDDAWADPLYVAQHEARIGNVRAMLGVPLMRKGAMIGVLALARTTPEPFTAKQIDLVTIFADQSVIAIENARLFTELNARTLELARSIEEMQLLSEVGQAVSSTLDLQAVLSTVLSRSVGLACADAGAIFAYDVADRAFWLVESFRWDAVMLETVRDRRIAETETAMGEAVARRTAVQIANLADRPSAGLRDASFAAGFRSVLMLPLVGVQGVLGALVLQRRVSGQFPPETVRLMQSLASQSVVAIQNAELFHEIADKSEKLALASQHKSQFLANMSHELRTPLNAILGFAELLVDGIYGQLPERPREALERIRSNGKHLLALINDVLDLAKIEAGELALTLEQYSLPDVVQSVVTATEPLAAAKGLKLTVVLQENLPAAYGDARRVSQVLLNLVGNAIKFTDEGEVEVRAAMDDGRFVLTLRDTGPGIAEADQQRIFDEFQQIDNSSTRKKGGTGLGLAISKRMIEMQGGTIAVDSVLAQGSTFRVVLPVHVEAMEPA
ncbi:MAG TPA: GAF domain-containing protein [Acetobacteraceae bacterium]|nr:GAF domain-containing protein [Acetobacteraceae bacterium]